MRCKFKLDSMLVTGTPAENFFSLEFSAVYKSGEDTENTKYWKYTPSGSFKVSTVNAAAVEGLEVGREYYLDISPAA